MRRFIQKVMVVLLVGIIGGAVQADWKAGLATEVITPSQSMWMSGYASRTKPAEGKVHDLWAKALCLEDPTGKRAILITLDLVGVGRETSLPIREKIAKKHKIDPESVTLACSHTHCGPVVGNTLRSMYFLDREQIDRISEYTTLLGKKIESVADRAIANLSPAFLSQESGTCDIAVNRRNNKEADVPKIRAEGKLVGPVDHSVPVLAVRDKAGKLKGVVFGYACHATVLSFQQWCGDYPGFAMDHLQERHPEAVAMFWAGCGADQNPLPRRSVELAQSYGKKLADAVDATLAKSMKPVQGALRIRYDEVMLPFAKIPDRETLLAQKGSKDKFEAARAGILLKQLEITGNIKGEYPYPISSWRMGDGPSWLWLGGEVVVDYSLRIKREHQGQTIWVGAYANDVMAYIPSLRVLNEGGYEGGTSMTYYGQPSPWGPSVEDAIIRKVEQLLK